MAYKNYTLRTNFNSSPYYDDFNEDKNFHRILFKPSLAVQARELTQLQTILQNQIDRFGEHIFKEGAIVLGGNTYTDLNYEYIKVSDLDSLNNPLNLSDLVGKELLGEAGVKAEVVGFENGSEVAAPNTKTLYLEYSNSGSNNTTKTFANGEILTANTGVIFDVLTANTSVGFGSMFSIGEGVVFAKDHFIKFSDQSIILDKYSNTPTYKVGFQIIEEIVDFTDDNSLLDPAQGSFNFSAPGADRLKLTAVLAKVAVDANTAAPDFVELLTIRNGIVENQVVKTEYSRIADEFARRTNDESGPYTVRGLNINIREHLNNGTNYGLYTQPNGGNSSLLAVGVEPGKAYVFGYEVENLITKYVNIEKGTDYKTVEQQVIPANYGNYVVAKELIGSFDVNSGTTVDLYNAVQTKISTRSSAAVAPTGSVIGTAKMKSVQHLSGTKGNADTTYAVYLYDVKMTSGPFTSVKSIYFNNASNADFFADIVLSDGKAVMQESAFNGGVFPIAASNIRKIRDEADQIDTTFAFNKAFAVTIGTGGTFTVSSGASDEIFPFSVGALNSAQKKKFLVSLNASATTANLTGTVAVTATSPTVTGSGTSFNTIFVPGDKIKINDTTEIYTILSIASATSMTLTSNVTTTDASSTFCKQYLSGDLIDFDRIGASAVARTISVSSTTSTSFDMKETLSGTVSASVIVPLNKTDAKEVKKTIQRNNYVKIDCSTNAATNVGPWVLGFSDVYQITEVRKHTSAFTTGLEGSDVTSSFVLDNGQKDNHYDLAKMRVKSGLSIGASDHLLVKLDYFSHDTSQGVGYFSVDSYPIDDVNGVANTNAITTAEIPVYTSSSGRKYNLRDSIDTRPWKTNTASTATTVAAATSNPVYAETITSPSGGIHTAIPNDNFVIDFSYYLKRKDVIYMTKNGDVGRVRGVPSLFPITPETPVDAMGLAVIEVAPFPSLPFELANAVGHPEYSNKSTKTSFKRYTMRDIGVLDKRITNLEYYVSLTMLEKDTLDLKIVDGDGLDRFKNGILVDPFHDHKIGDVNNVDYKIAVDAEKSMIRPFFELDNIPLEDVTLTGLVKNGNLISLPYTHEKFIFQEVASTTRNAAGAFYKYVGDMFLNPESDDWMDTTRLPDLQIVDEAAIASMQNWQALEDAWGTQWNDWETTWTGSPTTSTTRNSRSGGTTTTTTTSVNSSQTRTGLALDVNSTNIQQNFGDRVVDVSLIPFMRSRSIQVRVVGMRPEARLYAFFDGENVFNYITPTNSSFVATGAEGSNLVSDEDGSVHFLFRIPNDDVLKFRVGSKKLRVTDSITNAADFGNVTTSAEGVYSASGLEVTKQNTIVSTVVPQLSVTNLTETRSVTTRTSTSNFVERRDREGGGDPIGQSFRISTHDNSEGMFVSKIDLYFATKSSKNLGVIFEIRELDASGSITGNVVPYSRTYVPNASINVSNDSSVATGIVLSSPVYLMNETDYAFIVKPEANNADTSVWVSKLGELDILDGSRISQQPYSGDLFISSNDRNWEPRQDEDIKFGMYRAKFSTSSGTLVVGNRAMDYFKMANVTSSFIRGEEVIYGEDRVTLGSISGSVSNTHIMTGVTSGTIGVVRNNLTTPVMRVKKNDYTDSYTVGETVNFKYANNVSTGVTAVVSSVTKPVGSVHFYSEIDSSNIYLHVKDSTVSFATNEFVYGVSSTATGQVNEIQNKAYNLYRPSITSIIPALTAIEWSGKTTQNYTLDSSFTTINMNSNNDVDSEKNIVSRTLERANMSSNRSMQFNGVFSTASDYLSPIVDTTRMNSVLVKNIINNDSTGEDGVSGGNAITRYITAKATLAEDQDAEDLKVFLTSYRPSSTDVKVYAKYSNGEDSSPMEDRPWVELTLSSKDLYSSQENKEDFKEFEYTLPDSVLTGANDEVQYINTAGVTFTGFKYFAIKIVLLGSGSSLVPYCKDLRVVALQK